MRCGPGRRPIPWLGVPSWVACPLPADAAGQGHRINVLLKYLKLTRERFPRLSLVRRVLPDGARYLGPFPSAGQAELVKAAIEDAPPLRRCTMRLGARGGGSACALLELGRCLGPCTGAVADQRYEQAAGPRERLEAFTRARAEARRAAALASANEIDLARPHPEG